MDITRNRRMETEDMETKDEYHNYRSIAGSIIWVGNGSLTQEDLNG